MQAYTPNLNIWQEVYTIENLQQPSYARNIHDEKNQASRETWFDLLQYPNEKDNQKNTE